MLNNVEYISIVLLVLSKFCKTSIIPTPKHFSIVWAPWVAMEVLMQQLPYRSAAIGPPNSPIFLDSIQHVSRSILKGTQPSVQRFLHPSLRSRLASPSRPGQRFPGSVSAEPLLPLPSRPQLQQRKPAGSTRALEPTVQVSNILKHSQTFSNYLWFIPEI